MPPHPAHAAVGGRILSLTLSTFAAVSAADASTAAQLDALRQQQAELTARLAALEQSAARPSGNGPGVRLLDLSLDILTAAGGSTARDDEIATLQGGGHDPKCRGFSFQGAELSIAGAVDPFFTTGLHAVFYRAEPGGGTGVELEEAFVRSTCLPAGLEAKAGLYLTEFGRFNPLHPHAWSFIDQPVILTRVMGPDGMRAPGARLLWSMPTPWLSEVIAGVQNADGETCPSFLGAPEEDGGEGHDHPGGGPIGGYHPVPRDNGPKLLYSARWANGFDAGDTMVRLGASLAQGPNAGGEDTATTLWGADLAMKWRPTGGSRGWPFVIAEVEYLERRYEVDAIEAFSTGLDPADPADDITSSAPGGTLRDRGVVAQLIWGFHPGWSVGARWEYATGSGESIRIHEDDAGEEVHAEGRATDPWRDDRQRWSGLVGWQPSEFAHFRLQYNHDRADHLDRAEHSVWLGAEFLIGTHPAHVF
jgi:hypothetical protein